MQFEVGLSITQKYNNLKRQLEVGLSITQKYNKKAGSLFKYGAPHISAYAPRAQAEPQRHDGMIHF